MQIVRRRQHRWQALASVLCLLLSIVVGTPSADAHAELWDSSPAADETVGGEFHQIVMQFFGLDPAAQQSASLFDPAGNRVDSVAVWENQRIVLPIEPLTVPGEYTVTFEVNGIDGDLSDGSFSFRYDSSADEPGPVSPGPGVEPEGFDWITLGLLLVAAAIAAFLVSRFMTALREHRRDKAAAENRAASGSTAGAHVVGD